MTQTDPIRDAFFRRTLERDFKTILQRQLAIAQERVYRNYNRRKLHSGRLRSFLASGEMTVGTNPIHIQVNYPIQIRFLDMRKNGNLRIYNRQIWGKIYGETLPELRYGFTDEVRREVETQLKGLFPG